LPPGSPPATLTATALQTTNAGSITLNWSAVSGAMGYIIQRGTSALGTYTLLYNQIPLTATDTGLSANTTYYYKIAAMNSGGTSTSGTASDTTPPAAPTGLTATAGNTQTTLSWNAATGANSYVIGRSTVSGAE